MNTNNAGPITYYFENENNARDARDELIDLGVPDKAISIQTQASSKTFLDGLKEFFGAESPDRYTTGTLLTVDYADSNSEIEPVVQRYGGQLRADYMTERGQFMDEEQRMRLREERLSVNKQRVGEGEVRLRKDVVTENQRIDVPVRREEVYIERRGVDAAEPAYDTELGETEEIRVPVTHEEVTVEKHPVTTEEVAIGKRTVQEKQTVGGTVRKERARVETEGDVSPKGSIDEQ